MCSYFLKVKASENIAHKSNVQLRQYTIVNYFGTACKFCENHYLQFVHNMNELHTSEFNGEISLIYVDIYIYIYIYIYVSCVVRMSHAHVREPRAGNMRVIKQYVHTRTSFC